jgi:hypothetical protein
VAACVWLVAALHSLCRLTSPRRLQDAATKNEINKEAPFLQAARGGAALAHYSYASIDAAVALLIALQVYNANVGMAKGMMPNLFMQLYQNDIVKEEAFMAWREVRGANVAGGAFILTVVVLACGLVPRLQLMTQTMTSLTTAVAHSSAAVDTT